MAAIWLLGAVASSQIPIQQEDREENHCTEMGGAREPLASGDASEAREVCSRLVHPLISSKPCGAASFAALCGHMADRDPAQGPRASKELLILKSSPRIEAQHLDIAL